MRARLLAAAVLALLAGLVVAVPSVLAHGPPDPRDRETRLLQDWNDDCGGDSGAAGGGCKGSMDLLGLDVQEAYDPALGDIVIFRLYADKGQTGGAAGGHRAVITLTAGGAQRTFTFQTSDDAHFASGGGFERVGDARPLAGEPTRFSVDGTVRLATLGKAGDMITAFRVDSYSGNNVGDFMPGGCNNTVGSCIDTGQSSDQYVAGGGQGSYRLRGPSYYVRFDAPSSQQVIQGEETFVELHVENLLMDEPQSVTITVDGADGVDAGFHDPSRHPGTGHSDVARVDLPKRASSMVHLALQGETANRSGTLRLTLTTDLGGHATQEIAYTVTPGTPSTSSTCLHAMSGAHCPTASRTSPLAVPLALGALALALPRSRRT